MSWHLPTIVSPAGYIEGAHVKNLKIVELSADDTNTAFIWLFENSSDSQRAARLRNTEFRQGGAVMSLDALEQEEQDRIQYELQLAGQGGKKAKVWPSSDPSQRDRPKKSKAAQVVSSADYRLTLQDVRSRS